VKRRARSRAIEQHAGDRGGRSGPRWVPLFGDQKARAAHAGNAAHLVAGGERGFDVAADAPLCEEGDAVTEGQVEAGQAEDADPDAGPFHAHRIGSDVRGAIEGVDAGARAGSDVGMHRAG
jgi:hypothetical protein